MEKKPEVRSINGGKIWDKSFEKCSISVYVPDNDLRDDVLNYGFLAPYILVMTNDRMKDDELVIFAKEKGFEKIAKEFGSSVVFVNPNSANGWEDASPDILDEIITNSKIHQYFEDGMAKAYNRFTKQLEGYYIRGAIFRICMYGFGKSADYLAKHAIRHFEGDGLWGRADCAPTFISLSKPSVIPDIQADDIPIAYYGENKDIIDVVSAKAKYTLIKDKEVIYTDFHDFSKQFRRMCGQLELDPDLEKDGMIIEPGVFVTKTSPDNDGDDRGTEEHSIGYFAFYNKEIEKNKVPLLISFHGGGDSAMYIAHVSGWAKIAHKYGFLLVSIEDHLNSTATEMKALIEKLKEDYNIDASRIYVSGFSMGGCKSWDMIQEYPEILAAAAPMDATFEVGLNVFGQPVKKDINKDVAVPVFYVGGELTPLPELPFQAQKCIDRIEYVFDINKVPVEYEVKLEETDEWQNKIWGIDGDTVVKLKDPDRQGILTLQLFESADGKCYTVLGSVDNQGHECREHTCETAWKYMSGYRRVDGAVEALTIDEVKKTLCQ